MSMISPLNSINGYTSELFKSQKDSFGKNNESLIASYYTSTANSINGYASDLFKSQKDSFEKNNMSLIASQNTLTEITAMASDISAMSQDLKKTRDQDAINGFQLAMQTIASNPQKGAEFIAVANNIQNEDSETFKKIFSSINDLNEKGSKNYISHFMSTISDTYKTYGIGVTQNLVDSVDSIAGREWESSANLRSTLSNFFNIFNSLKNSVVDTDQMESAAKDLSNRIKTEENVNNINNLMSYP